MKFSLKTVSYFFFRGNYKTDNRIDVYSYSCYN